ncbi:MAG: trypsin-like peptidase domain-containing protein [Oscillospiraceae bacterium]|nr:trypsin-like peptidase domain-containing protein [Oscillospiraceae bacterium]
MFDENTHEEVQPSNSSPYRFVPETGPEPVLFTPQEEAPVETTPDPVAPETPQEREPETPPYFQQAPQYVPEPELPKKKKKEKKKRKFTALKVTALALCFSLIGGFLGSGITAYLFDEYYDEKPSPAPGNTSVLEGQREDVVIDKETVDTSKQMTPAEVYATNVESTVGITTSITTNYWGYQTTSAASGSGFIYSADGYILTNHHVIEGSSSITVSFYDGTSASAKLIGYDESNDIAVLKVDAQNLMPVTLGNSNNMNVGDTVLAIGNPLGELTFTLTSGIVSALGRQVTTSSGVTMTLIQTDCAINSGNSGGALFNLYGEVIGITNAKYSSNSSSEASIDNIGFAIPISHVRSIVDSIISKGYYSKPYVGISVTDVSAETQSYGLPQGAAVKQVVEGAPAAEAGLQVNDIITKVDGKEITGSSDLVGIVSKSAVGQTLTLTVYRMGAYIELKLTVGEQKQTATPQQNSGSNHYNPYG